MGIRRISRTRRRESVLEQAELWEKRVGGVSEQKSGSDSVVVISRRLYTCSWRRELLLALFVDSLPITEEQPLRPGPPACCILLEERAPLSRLSHHAPDPASDRAYSESPEAHRQDTVQEPRQDVAVELVRLGAVPDARRAVERGNRGDQHAEQTHCSS